MYIGVIKLAKPKFYVTTAIDYVNADCLHKASIKGKLQPFIDILKKKNVILVAPKYLGKLKIHNTHIEVPELNCWLNRKRIMERCIYNATANEKAVFIFCCGMPANIFIHRLYENFGKKHTFIDAGSVFDPYVGKKTRKYHYDLKI